MTLYELIKNQQHRQRLKEILEVFAEQGLGFLVSRIKLSSHLPFTKRLRARIAKEKEVPIPVRLRLAFEQLGPTFIKFGQLLSLRPDLLPPDYLAEFEKMQDKVPAFSTAEAKKIIEQELKKPISKLFTSFNSTPLASASIAQVYKARIGKKAVAVKVQRPQIKETITTDIELMYKLADLLEEHIPELKKYHLHALIHEFERWTIKELNFLIEAYYAGKIAENSKGNPAVKIPAIYPQLSTNKVLTMEFVEGIPLHDFKELRRRKINIRTAFRNGYATFMKHVFIDGLFHADPHPGNILILPAGRIGLIDFGIVGQFDKQLKQDTLELFQTMMDGDYERAARVLLRLGSDGDIDKKEFQNDLRTAFEQFQYSSIKDIHLGQLLQDILHIINRHHLRVPLEFVLFEKTMLTLEGLALKYQPDINLAQETKTTLRKLLDYRYLAKSVLQRGKRKINEYRELADIFPETAMELLEKAKQFKLNIEIKDTEVKDLTAEIERSSGNMAMGVIIAALMVASAIMIQAGLSAYIYGSGFGIAGILALWLIHRTIFVKIIKR